MSRLSRREFIGAAAALPGLAWARPHPNDIFRVAVVGLNGRGGAHLQEYLGMKDVEVVAICDADENVGARKAGEVEKKAGKKPAFFKDLRKLLEDKSIDAVSIATTNHNHALNAIWAVQAGKHVYVEKPLSHNVFEGRVLVKAARKYNRIVQHGTQSRSSGFRQTVAGLQAGALGKIQVSRGLCYKPRPSIGKAEGAQPVPAGVDYDIWSGPAPMMTITRKKFHYDWHWLWAYGNGDMGNQGVHEMDKARWALGKGLPKRVMSVGGRFGYVDDGETPNTLISCFDYGDGQQIIFEVRGLKNLGDYMGEKIGNIVHCADGHTVGGQAFDKAGRKTDMKAEKATGGPGGGHFGNFVAACRSGKQTDLNADVLEGHLSSALCHLGNISYRLGESRPFGKPDVFGDNAAGNETFERFCAHLKENGVDLPKVQLCVGRNLEFNPETEKFVNDREADKLLTREYRQPFVVPENP